MSRTIRPATHEDTVQELGSASYLHNGCFAARDFIGFSRIRVPVGVEVLALRGVSFGAP